MSNQPSWRPDWPTGREFWRDAGLSSERTATMLAAVHEHVVVRYPTDSAEMAELVRVGYVRPTAGGMFCESTPAGCAALATMRKPTLTGTEPPKCWICSIVTTYAERTVELRGVQVSDLDVARKQTIAQRMPIEPLPMFAVRICSSCFSEHIVRYLSGVKDRLAGVEKSDDEGG